MKNFTITTIYKTLIICCLGLFLANCEGEDGAIGSAGEKGADGTNGSNGANGANGENGLGFDELVKYGDVTLTLTGTRPDDVAFTDTSTFKFIPIRKNYNLFFKGEDYNSFDFNRFLSTPGNRFQRSNIGIELDVRNPGSEEQVFEYFRLDINRFDIISDDLTFFRIDESRFTNEGRGVSNFSITNYSYNEETNTLVFSFSFDVNSDNNLTRNDLSVAGEIDVVLFTDSNPPR